MCSEWAASRLDRVVLGGRITDRASSCAAQAANGRRGAHVECQTVPRIVWHVLCHGSCSAVLGGPPLGVHPPIDVLREPGVEAYAVIGPPLLSDLLLKYPTGVRESRSQ